MSDLLFIEFASGKKAEGVRETLLAMQREYQVDPEDARRSCLADSCTGGPGASAVDSRERAAYNWPAVRCGSQKSVQSAGNRSALGRRPITGSGV